MNSVPDEETPHAGAPTARNDRLRTALRRLPLRLRLVAGFTGVMLVLLTAAGGFVYWRVDYALDRRLDIDLSAQAAAVRPLVADDGSLRPGLTTADGPALDDFQVLDGTGRVVSSGTALRSGPLLGTDALARARRGPLTLDVGSLFPVSPRPLRVLAQPIGTSSPAPTSDLVLVVAVRRDERDEALRELVVQMALAGLGTLLVSTVVGERLAKAALAPVERYRAQAQRIAAGAGGLRLDVPTHRDDEVTRLGRTLNDMLTALERSAARERRFVDDASHELRTPLTVLLTRVELTSRRRRTVEEHEAVLRELRSDISDLVTLAENLLALGAAHGGGDGPERDPAGRAAGDGHPCRADVMTVARRLRSSTGGGVPGMPPAWSLVGPAEGSTPVGLSDLRLRQVLLNLLTNAERHGAPPVTVTVGHGSGSRGDVVTLTVTDTGPGVPQAFLPRAVERFGRTAEARSRPGAGLGLALVHTLVAGCGGELRLCSHGVHHRYEHRHDIACAHPEDVTAAVVILPARG